MHAAGVLLAVEALIRWVPLARLSRMFGTRLNLEPVLDLTPPLDPTELSVRDRRHLRSARRVTDAWPFGRGTCLRRSLVVGHLIRRLRPTIRLGLVEVADDFTAHAWVEIDDRPLESIAGYAIFQQRETRYGDVTGSGRVFEHCGLRIRSEIDVALPVAAGTEWDVDVCIGPVTSETRNPLPGEVIALCQTDKQVWYTATRVATGYRLRFRDCCDMAISADLSHVEVRPAPSEAANVIPVLLAGTLVAFLLTLRGDAVLHASAVAVGGRALAFTGPSGSGKTTLAALLCVEAGGDLVTDDVLVVEPGPPATCIGGASELRLREASAGIATTRPEFPSYTTVDARVAFAPATAAAGHLPLSAIVIPGKSRTAAAVEVARMGEADALVAILALPRVYGWRDPEVLNRTFSTIAQIVNKVPVYLAMIPGDPHSTRPSLQLSPNSSMVECRAGCRRTRWASSPETRRRTVVAMVPRWRGPVLLTMSGVIPADLDDAIAGGRRPRADYREVGPEPRRRRRRLRRRRGQSGQTREGHP